jgi:hypothetical protein
MDHDLESIKQDIDESIREHIEENFVGQPNSQLTMETVRYEVLRHYSEGLGIPMEKLELRNFRVENDGRAIVWDGVDIRLFGDG